MVIEQVDTTTVTQGPGVGAGPETILTETRSFLAGAFLNLKEHTGINVATIVVSVIGAIIVVFVANLLMANGRRRV